MRKDAAWLEIDLDRSTRAPSMRQQIEKQVAEAIRTGKLPRGSRLPSSRMMASLLRVSRGTVVEAYEALIGNGALTSIAGSGIYIASVATTIPNFSNLKRTVAAAHYPTRVCFFEDVDGTSLYLNVIR